MPKTTVKRSPQKARTDVSIRDAILDAALVAHVGFVDEGQPYVMPLAFVRDGERLLVHGSSASRAMKVLATGAPACATVTILDALVVARSQFESSMHYRGVSVMGSFEMLESEAKAAALAVLGEKLIPATGARSTAPQESKATAVLALPLDVWSAKVSDGPVDDAPEDEATARWAGIIPLHHTWGEAQDAEDLPEGTTRPDAAIQAWTQRGLA